MNSAGLSTLLQSVLAGVAQARQPKDAAQALLDACCEHLGAAGGMVYLLDLTTATYRPFGVALSRTSDLDQGRPIEDADLAVSRKRITTLDEFLEAVSPAGQQRPPRGAGLAVYARRDTSCLGVICLDGVQLDTIEQSLSDDLIACSDLLVSIYEDRFAFNLLETLQEPLDFSQTEEAFLDSIGFLIAQSSGMEFVALRERTDERLRCLALWGFDDHRDLEREAWDLEPIAAFPPFSTALKGRTRVVPDVDTPELAELRKRPWSRDVRSFVTTPVRVGKSIFGVLSLAARCKFQYAPLELRGFESIANGIGVSITNFRASHELAAQTTEYSVYAVAMTGMEIARAARHEAVGLIDNCFLALGSLRRYERFVGKQANDFKQEADDFEEDLNQLGATLDKIKFATKAPKVKREQVRLIDLWDQAINTISGRLTQERITTQWTGPRDLEVIGLPDWLRQIFLNLLLNSVDAFRDAKKTGRRIELSVERPPPRANVITMTYHDNAGGINPQRLSVPTKHADEPVQQQIFQPEVTSKSEGSGYGLWLVRNILNNHHGSIDLTNYRQGVTFVIRLPKPGKTNQLEEQQDA